MLPVMDVTEYAYDAAGNRTSVTANGKTTAYAANVLNQYTRYGDVSREYDADENLIRETGPDGAASLRNLSQSQPIRIPPSSKPRNRTRSEENEFYGPRQWNGSLPE